MPFLEDTGLPLLSPVKSSIITTFPRHRSSISASPTVNMSSNGGYTGYSAANTSVAEALEIARESSEGAQDPGIVNILETALYDIWAKIQAQPTTYVMTRDEFAVFNYYQSRSEGDELAVEARRRYWDHLRIVDGGQ